MIICLTNDDGVLSSGLRVLYYAMQEAGHCVHVVAPFTEQSAVGHAITIRGPLRAHPFKENGFSGIGVHGTPADCVKLGIGELIGEKPDIVVSGINVGANVGPDIMYSGTVAAAREAAALGFPALAVSCDVSTPTDLKEQAHYTVQLLSRLPWSYIPERRFLNLNFPACPLPDTKGLKLCPQTTATWRDWYHRREDPRGNSYWWLDGEISKEQVAPDTDRACLSQGWITLTPLRFDFTDEETLATLTRCLP